MDYALIPIIITVLTLLIIVDSIKACSRDTLKDKLCLISLSVILFVAFNSLAWLSWLLW